MTERDHQILLTLSHKVRLLTLKQVAGAWWNAGDSGVSEARKRLRDLASRNLVERRRLNIHPELELNEPVITWEAGEAEPDFDAVSYKLRSRWNDAARLTTFYTATTHAVNQFGGPASAAGPLKRPQQATHDIHVSALYLRLLRNDPDAAARWASERVIASERRKQKLPDAILKNVDGRDELVIEFGGQYSARRVGHFHADCSNRLLPYELW